MSPTPDAVEHFWKRQKPDSQCSASTQNCPSGSFALHRPSRHTSSASHAAAGSQVWPSAPEVQKDVTHSAEAQIPPSSPQYWPSSSFAWHLELMQTRSSAHAAAGSQVWPSPPDVQTPTTHAPETQRSSKPKQDRPSSSLAWHLESMQTRSSVAQASVGVQDSPTPPEEQKPKTQEADSQWSGLAQYRPFASGAEHLELRQMPDRHCSSPSQ